MMKKTFIFNFDHTFIQTDSLSVLAENVLANQKNKESILKTYKGLNEKTQLGRYPFSESLDQRLDLLKIDKSHLLATVAELQNQLTPSFLRLKSFFSEYKNQIYVLTGSFIEIVWPILEQFDLKRENIYANSFVFDYAGNVINFDKRHLMAQDQGKVKQLQKLHFPGDIMVIGNSYRDYEMKAVNLANSFFAVTENVEREAVINEADGVFPELDGLLLACNISLLGPSLS